jgi:CRP-like cAMP-binding protein
LLDPVIASLTTQNVLRNRAEELSDVEREVLEGAISETSVFRSGHVVVRQAERVDISTLLVQGFMTRHVDARDGRRHLVAVHVPGDFVDLHAYALKKLDHDVGALTDVTVRRLSALHAGADPSRTSAFDKTPLVLDAAGRGNAPTVDLPAV